MGEKCKKGKDGYLTPTAFGRKLNPPMNRQTVYRWIQIGKLNAKTGSPFGDRQAWYIPESELARVQAIIDAGSKQVVD